MPYFTNKEFIYGPKMRNLHFSPSSGKKCNAMSKTHFLRPQSLKILRPKNYSFQLFQYHQGGKYWALSPHCKKSIQNFGNYFFPLVNMKSFVMVCARTEKMVLVHAPALLYNFLGQKPTFFLLEEDVEPSMCSRIWQILSLITSVSSSPHNGISLLFLETVVQTDRRKI